MSREANYDYIVGKLSILGHKVTHSIQFEMYHKKLRQLLFQLLCKFEFGCIGTYSKHITVVPIVSAIKSFSYTIFVYTSVKDSDSH